MNSERSARNARVAQQWYAVLPISYKDPWHCTDQMSQRVLQTTTYNLEIDDCRSLDSTDPLLQRPRWRRKPGTPSSGNTGITSWTKTSSDPGSSHSKIAGTLLGRESTNCESKQNIKYGVWNGFEMWSTEACEGMYLYSCMVQNSHSGSRSLHARVDLVNN